MRKLRYFTVCWAVWILYWSSFANAALPHDEIQITFAAGDNIRALAQTHLNNPDLWPDILHANGLQSPHELLPGTTLNIPVRLILAVDEHTREAQVLIGRASRDGARALAADTVMQAIQAHSEALNARSQGDWDTALSRATTAVKMARQALDETERQRNLPAEAVLESLGGSVQRRPPGTWSWLRAEPKVILAEQEKLRTLSDSFAEIRFHDNSRLRLNANAELLIQKMREDSLNQHKNTGVVLQGGNIYALLGGNAQARNFDVQLQGVETKIESNNFWLERQNGTARLANYDGKIEVKSGGTSVMVGANQGTLVKPNQKPSAPKDLLPPPDNLQPGNYTTVYTTKLNLSWDTSPDAAGYWLEIASDHDFKQLAANHQALRSADFSFEIPANGLYYWRVSTLDQDGLPGSKSQVRFFKAQIDHDAPYLVLTTPLQGAVTAENPLHITGRSELHAQITCNNTPVELDAEGGFSCEQTLLLGINHSIVTASDPAGNVTRLERQVEYLHADSLPLSFGEDLPAFSAGHFVVNRSQITLHGRTWPLAALKLHCSSAEQTDLAAFADTKGDFQLNIPLTATYQAFTLTTTLPTGAARSEDFQISRDMTPPRIHLDPLPTFSITPQLVISGNVEEAEQLLIGDEQVAIDDNGRFQHPLQLQPGTNSLDLQARDIAGNHSQLQRRVVLDSDPPQLIKYALSQPTARSGSATIQLSVQAHDTNGLKAGAAYQLQIGTQTRNGYLRLDRDGETYRDKIQLAPDAQGKLILRSVVLEDYAGNQKKYQFEAE